MSRANERVLPNEDGTTPLMAAAGVGIWAVGESPGTNEEALDAVRYALALGGGVTTVDDNGDTALHGAVIPRLRAAGPLPARPRTRADCGLPKRPGRLSRIPRPLLR